MSWVDKYDWQTKPYHHQQEYLERHAEDPYHALFWEMGSGKSFAIIANVARLYDQHRIKGLLVIALNGVHSNWSLREIPTHMPDHIEYDAFTWSSRKSSKWKKAHDAILKPSDKLRIATINVEALSHPSGVQFCADFIASCGKQLMCVVDESSTIKNPKAKRTKAVIKVGSLCTYRRILTGTPITQAPFDVFAQSQFLKPGLLGFKTYFAFQRRYAVFRRVVLGARSFEQVDSYTNLPELRNKLDAFATFVKKSECLDLPPKIYETRTVDMPAEQVRAYNNMRDLLMTDLQHEGETKVITAANALTKLTKLHQVLTGHMIDEDGVAVPVPNNRAKVLEECLHETSGKVIIWANYRAAIKDVHAFISEKFGSESVVQYHGGVSESDRNEAIDSFQDPDSPVRFFIGNQASAGYGLTLTQATTVIYYANGYSLEQRLQSEDRAHRPGQHFPVTYIDLVVPDTVDESVMRALKAKVDVATQVTGLIDSWI